MRGKPLNRFEPPTRRMNIKKRNYIFGDIKIKGQSPIWPCPDSLIIG
jgi:hypothetical protein